MHIFRKSSGPAFLFSLAGLALLAGLFFFPFSPAGEDRLIDALWDWLHTPAFLLVYPALRRLLGRPRRALLAGLVFAMLVELLQPLFGREASWADLAYGAAGLFAGYAWCSSFRAGRLAALVLVGLSCLPVCRIVLDRMEARNRMPLLAGFETARELGRWETSGGSLTRSRAHATGGQWSGRFEITGPDPYPGLTLRDAPPDWSAAQAWELDCYLEGSEPAALHVRMDDREEQPVYGERFQVSIPLEPGANRIRLPVSDFGYTSGGRPMDLKTMSRCVLFFDQNRLGLTLYFDRMRLLPDESVIAPASSEVP